MPFEITTYRNRQNVFYGDLGDVVNPIVLGNADGLVFKVGPESGPPLLTLTQAPTAAGSAVIIDSLGTAPNPTANPPVYGQPAQYTVTIAAADLAALPDNLSDVEMAWQPAGGPAQTVDRGGLWVLPSLG